MRRTLIMPASHQITMIFGDSGDDDLDTNDFFEYDAWCWWLHKHSVKVYSTFGYLCVGKKRWFKTLYLQHLDTKLVSPLTYSVIMQTKTSAPYSPLVKMSYRASPPPTLHTPSGQRTTPQGPQSPPSPPQLRPILYTYIPPFSWPLICSTPLSSTLCISHVYPIPPWSISCNSTFLSLSYELYTCLPLPHPNDRLWHFSPTPSPPPPPFENLPYPIISFPVFDMV